MFKYHKLFIIFIIIFTGCNNAPKTIIAQGDNVQVIESQIYAIASTVYESHKFPFVTAFLTYRNDTNYVSFINSALINRDYLPITKDSSYYGYINRQNYLIILWGQKWHNFIGTGALGCDNGLLDSLLLEIEISPKSKFTDLNYHIYLINEKDSLIFYKEEPS